MIIVVGEARVREDFIEVAIAASGRVQEASRSEAGCIQYRLSVDVADPCRIQLFEIWESDEALARHVNQAHVIEFLRTVNKVLDEEPVYQRYVVEDARDDRSR